MGLVQALLELQPLADYGSFAVSLFVLVKLYEIERVLKGRLDQLETKVKTIYKEFGLKWEN